MHNFYIWFSTGISHIINWGAYDHVLFLFALCSGYTFRQWKKMLILITAFTVGHSLTLALSVFHVFSVHTVLIEFFIAGSIILTCMYNLQVSTGRMPDKIGRSFWMAVLFGLIHGLGFASALKEMLSGDHILFPLFSFNVGIEVGQLLVVVLLLGFMQFVRITFHLKQVSMVFSISIAIAVIAFIVAVNRFTDIFYHYLLS